MNLIELRKEMKHLFNKDDAKILQKFFKTGPGEYGEGDKFVGIKVPPLRILSKKYKEISFDETLQLLASEIHEERLLSLFILIQKFEKADDREKNRIYKYYLKNKRFINNWDLIDLSAPKIVGEFLLDKDRSILYKLAKSKNIWDKRIAILSTFRFIKENQFEDALNICEILLNDNHDLIHKAVGWMLREIGKRNLKTEEKFLLNRYKKMPRTMLRYAIEKFTETKRQAYLKSKV